jgi:hypothetical protein
MRRMRPDEDVFDHLEQTAPVVDQQDHCVVGVDRRFLLPARSWLVGPERDPPHSHELVRCDRELAHALSGRVKHRIRHRRRDARRPQLADAFRAQRAGVGRIINPRTARAQMTGAIIWGWGMAAMEASHHEPTLGRWLSKNLAGVAIRVNADIPGDLQIHFVDEFDAHAL